MNSLTTRTIPFDAPDAFESAQTLLDDGQVIAGPTDTVYGLMCRYADQAALELLYEVKGRPPHKAIPVLLGDVEQAVAVAQTPLPLDAQRFAERFWPGALTIIVPALPDLPAILTAGQQTIALRIPAHPLLRQLLTFVGPLATTSANLSGAPETHSAQEVLTQLNGRIPLLLDGGGRVEGQASTIIDLSRDTVPLIVRPGPLEAQVRAMLSQESV